MEVQTGKIISAQKAPTHFMLAAKIVILVATVVLYVMQMLIAVPLFGAFVLEENWGELDNTRLAFKQNGVVIAYFSNNSLMITDAEVRNRLSFGTADNGYFDFIPRANGNLSVRYRNGAS